MNYACKGRFKCAVTAQTTKADDVHLCRDGADDAEECAVMAQWRRRRNIRRRVCRDGADDADTDDECAVTAQATRRSAP